MKNPIALPLSLSHFLPSHFLPSSPLGLERLRKAYTGFPAQKLPTKRLPHPKASPKKQNNMQKYIFETEMEVRDYECDIQGIVNNANYLHYTEHTRHQFLVSLGVSFAQLHERGIDAVVARMNLQYKQPLRCDDSFISRLGLKKEGLRYIFNQDLYRKSDGALCFKSSTELVVLVNGRLAQSPDYDKAFAPFLKEEEK